MFPEIRFLQFSLIIFLYCTVPEEAKVERGHILLVVRIKRITEGRPIPQEGE